MHLYACVYYVCLHACIYARGYVCICMRVCIHAHMYIHPWMYIHPTSHASPGNSNTSLRKRVIGSGFRRDPGYARPLSLVEHQTHFVTLNSKDEMALVMLHFGERALLRSEFFQTDFIPGAPEAAGGFPRDSVLGRPPRGRGETGCLPANAPTQDSDVVGPF